MIFEYSLDKNDFLMHQLYSASKSEHIKKRRQRNKILISILYIVLGLYFWLSKDFISAWVFIFFGILWFFFFPMWEKRRYINHFKAHINEHYKGRLGKNAIVNFENDFITEKVENSESKISTDELKEIYEIPAVLLIKLKTGQSLIIPKNKIKNLVVQYLQNFLNADSIKIFNLR